MKNKLLNEIILWGKLVKFSHSIFALPFALSMFAIVARDNKVLLSQLIYIVIALISARTVAMGFNRLADHKFDAANPRTNMRELPRGVIKRSSVIMMCLVNVLIFHIVSGLLGSHCLYLAPFVIFWLLFYSLTKRFTNLSHIVLGISLAMAPGGVWYALVGTFALQPILLMIAVLFWVAGFDLLYASQDVEFDKSHKLHSLPAAIGIKASLMLALVFHGITIIFLYLFGTYSNCALIYYLGLIAFSFLLISQHRIVSEKDLSKLDIAFFARNGVASVVYFVAVLLDVIYSYGF